MTDPKTHGVEMTKDTGALHEFRAAFDDDSVARKNLALRKAHDELAAAQARITQLETALRPFAKSGELFDGYEGTCLIYDPAKGREWGLSSDDLKTARRALTDDMQQPKQGAY